LIFDPSLPSSAGEPMKVAKLTRRLLAPNAGAFTFSGTCSYIVGEGEVAIIDPGPAIPAHIDALMDAIRADKLVGILVTHTHCDHSPAAQTLRAITGAPVLGCAPYAAADDIATRARPNRVESRDRKGLAQNQRVGACPQRKTASHFSGTCSKGPGLDASHDRDYAPDRVLTDGESLALGGATIETVATPGHTANHLCYALREECALFTGDHVMGWATSVIAPPDGSMADYMASLEKLRARDDLVYWPAHGAAVEEPQRYVRGLMAHRRQREAAILRRLEAGDETIAQMVAHIYHDVDPRLHGAAALNILAHLEDLCARGAVGAKGAPTLLTRYKRL
jgi:glyoxylase-like metal-dependent hydrolase (beta-lactamase superfamily II)